MTTVNLETGLIHRLYLCEFICPAKQLFAYGRVNALASWVAPRITLLMAIFSSMSLKIIFQNSYVKRQPYQENEKSPLHIQGVPKKT